ncbi:MAG: exonuclease domain-containing protein [Myxococcales bacterium]|nr:exonuclease domain-containing protein [Myxococcales bacterium]
MDPHLLVVDLEATCDRAGFPRARMEIIEIGAVLVDPENLQPIREFATFVRPVVQPRLTAFCTELTSIRQQDVDDAPTFPEALEAWRRWLDRRVLLASWGAYDKYQLLTDADRHGVKLPFGSRHLDLKQVFAEQSGRRRMGMMRALKLVGLPHEGTHHRGIDDARNTVRLLPWALGRRGFPDRVKPSPSGSQRRRRRG